MTDSDGDECSNNKRLSLNTDALVVIPKPDQEILAATVQDDQEKEMIKCNAENVMTQMFDQISLTDNRKSGVTVTCRNLQIGNNNAMTVSPDKTEKKPKKKKVEIEKLIKAKKSTKILTKSDLEQISGSIGKRWRSIGRCLGLTDANLDEISHDFNVDGLKEICYQMMRFWYEKNASECTVGTLAKAFIVSDNSELIDQLPLDE